MGEDACYGCTATFLSHSRRDIADVWLIFLRLFLFAVSAGDIEKLKSHLHPQHHGKSSNKECINGPKYGRFAARIVR